MGQAKRPLKRAGTIPRSDVKHAAAALHKSVEAMRRSRTQNIPPAFVQALRDYAETADERERTSNRVVAKLIEYQTQFDRAVEGDNEALVWLFNDSGIAMLEDEPIRNRVDALRYSLKADRPLLKRIARAIERSLLDFSREGPGRRAATDREIVSLLPVVQSAFDKHRSRLKPRYNNQGAKRLAIRELSGHIASSVPDRFRAAIAEAATTVLLSSRKRPGRGFGIEVVAKACSRTSRQIRSLQSKERSRK